MTKRICGRPHKKRCRHCKTWFVPDRRNYPKQRYCGKRECRQASKKASQRKWLAKNPSYFRDSPEVSPNLERVRAWRARNPKYWQREKRNQERLTKCSDTKNDSAIQIGSSASRAVMEQSFPSRSPTLQDLLISQLPEKTSIPAQNSETALQDLLIKHHFVLEGLTTHLFGDALQDSARSALDLCYAMGRKKGQFYNPFNPKIMEDKNHDP